MSRSLAAAALSTLALALAGCGGTTETAATGAASGPGATAIVPSDVAAFVSLDTQGDSDQREQLGALLEKFPGADDALESALADALGSGADWDDDVEPALGPELAIVLLPEAKGAVGLTQPDDLGKLEALLRRGGDDAVTREIDGWRAIGDASDLDVFERSRGGDTLADSDDFAAAFEGLPGTALATVYARGDGLRRLAGGTLPLPGAGAATGGNLDTAAAVVQAMDDGLRLQGRATSSGSARVAAPYEPTLLERVPGDAFLAASFGGLDDGLSQLRSNDLPFLPELEQALGVTLDDLTDVFDGEGILYARSGLLIPEVTLALSVDDERKAVATLRSIADNIAPLVQGKIGTAEVDGVDVTYVDIRGVRVSFAAFDGRLLVTTGAAGIRDFRRDGDKLADDGDFERAAEQAGLGERTSGFLYVDAQEALPIVEALANFSGDELPDRVRENLDPVESLFLHTTADGAEARFGGVLSVR